MRLLADFHTHTKDSRFFHGKHTIEEMVLQANEMGLKEIAITDHGFKHWCRTSKQKLAHARKTIDEINTWSKTKVLLGIEADIISEDGTLDIDNETIEFLDILVIGYHRLISTDFANYFGVAPKTEDAKRKCTNAYLNAIEKYPVTIVAHLDSILSTDLYEIGVACANKGVMVEINNRHTKWNEDQINDLIASDCMFVLSSDAHDRYSVGKVDKCFDLIRKYQIPTENIANVEFDEDEMSEEHKEFSLYYEIYKDKLNEMNKRTEEKRKEVQGLKQEATLSNEMEEALTKIAKEKGIRYDSRVANVHTESDGGSEVEINMLELMAGYDSEELIKQANEFLKNNSMQEFDTQNEKLETEEFVSVEAEQEKVESEVQPAETKTGVLEQPEITEEKKDDDVLSGLMFAKAQIAKPKAEIEEKGDIELKSEHQKVQDEKAKEEKKINQRKAKSKLNPLAVLDIDNLSDTKK